MILETKSLCLFLRTFSFCGDSFQKIKQNNFVSNIEYITLKIQMFSFPLSSILLMQSLTLTDFFFLNHQNPGLNSTRSGLLHFFVWWCIQHAIIKVNFFASTYKEYFSEISFCSCVLLTHSLSSTQSLCPILPSSLFKWPTEVSLIYLEIHTHVPLLFFRFCNYSTYAFSFESL